MAILDRLLESPAPSRVGRGIICACFALFYSANSFTRTVVASAHFEPLLIALTSALFWVMLTRPKSKWVWVLLALALETREDMGVVLGAQLFGLLFIPRCWWVRGASARKVAICCGVGLLYTAIVVAVVMPRFGSQGTRFWAHYGSSWGEVGVTMLTHPEMVARDVETSGFEDLNASVLFLSAVDAPMGVLVNLAGLHNFTAGEEARHELRYYNAAPLLPGIFLASSSGFVVLLILLTWLGGKVGAPRMEVAVMALGCVFGLALAKAPFRKFESIREQIRLQALPSDWAAAPSRSDRQVRQRMSRSQHRH